MSIEQLKEYNQFGQTKRMIFIEVFTAGIKIPFFIFTDQYFVFLLFQDNGSFDSFVLCKFDGCLIAA